MLTKSEISSPKSRITGDVAVDLPTLDFSDASAVRGGIMRGTIGISDFFSIWSDKGSWVTFHRHSDFILWSIVMGVPYLIAGWFISWKIPSINGWWLEVPLW
jgi:hypothetical protein